MSEEIDLLKEFSNKLVVHGQKKATLYDGCNSNTGPRLSVDNSLRFLIEEVGEVASAITRDRIELAKSECIDVAHCAFLVYLTLSKSND